MEVIHVVLIEGVSLKGIVQQFVHSSKTRQWHPFNSVFSRTSWV